MKPSLIHTTLALLLLGAAASPLAQAVEEAPKTLPTLIIKGEVVSVDANDPTVTVLKVKDRYGFETPIQLIGDTKIAQGDHALKTSDLTPGSAVEVEYNFDINTAKRHAVRVEVSQAAPAAAAPAPAAATPATAAPAAEAPAAAAESTTATASVSTEVMVKPAAAPAATTSAPAPAPAAAPVASAPAAAGKSAPAKP